MREHHGPAVCVSRESPQSTARSGVEPCVPGKVLSVEGWGWGIHRVCHTILVFFSSGQNRPKSLRVQPIRPLVGLIHWCREIMNHRQMEKQKNFNGQFDLWSEHPQIVEKEDRAFGVKCLWTERAGRVFWLLHQRRHGTTYFNHLSEDPRTARHSGIFERDLPNAFC